MREEEVRIISDVQTLLREFDRRDLAGAAGAERWSGVARYVDR